MWKARQPAGTEMPSQKCMVQGMSHIRTLPQLQQPVHQNFPEKVSSAVEKIVSQPVPNTNKSTTPKTVTANKCSTVGFYAGSNNNCYKTRSGHEVRKPPRYR